MINPNSSPAKSDGRGAQRSRRFSLRIAAAGDHLSTLKQSNVEAA